MQKLSDFLLSPNTPIFKNVMTIDTDGLVFLVNSFADAYQKAKHFNSKDINLNANWVKELAEYIFFIDKKTQEEAWYQIGYNTKQFNFSHHSTNLSSTKVEASDLFIDSFGKDAILKPKAIPMNLLLKFLVNYHHSKEEFVREDKLAIDLSKVKVFNIRDYNTEEEINIPLTELRYNIPF